MGKLTVLQTKKRDNSMFKSNYYQFQKHFHVQFVWKARESGSNETRKNIMQYIYISDIYISVRCIFQLVTNTNIACN